MLRGTNFPSGREGARDAPAPEQQPSRLEIQAAALRTLLQRVLEAGRLPPERKSMDGGFAESVEIHRGTDHTVIILRRETDVGYGYEWNVTVPEQTDAPVTVRTKSHYIRSAGEYESLEGSCNQTSVINRHHLAKGVENHLRRVLADAMEALRDCVDAGAGEGHTARPGCTLQKPKLFQHPAWRKYLEQCCEARRAFEEKRRKGDHEGKFRLPKLPQGSSLLQS